MIPLFKPIYRTEEVLDALEDTLNSSWTGMGGKCVDFEEAFKDYTVLPHAHFLNSATSGLHLALEILKRNYISYNREREFRVATTPLTFVSTNHAILHAGLIPEFVDVDSSLCMDPVELEKVIEEAIAVIFVAIGGNPGQLVRIQEICRNHKVPLIIDASHAMGTWITYKDFLEMKIQRVTKRHIGYRADFTIFSFQAVKNLSTGDGGMICCAREEDDKLARKLSWLGISKPTHLRDSWDYEVKDIGWKYHGNAIAASIGLVGLKYINQDNYRRGTIHNLYNGGLVPYIETITNPRYTCDTSSTHLYQILVPAERRNRIINFARERGVQLGVHYRSNLSYPMYRDYFPCLTAEKYSRELISLPMGTHLSDEDVTKVVKVVNDGFNRLD